VDIDSPIIFITAYNEYAIDAFKVNSVGYLLKPVKKAELKIAIEKYRKLYADSKSDIDYNSLAKLINKEDYQKRIVVRYGNTIKAIEIDDIAYFFTESGNILFRTLRIIPIHWISA